MGIPPGKKLIVSSHTFYVFSESWPGLANKEPTVRRGSEKPSNRISPALTCLKSDGLIFIIPPILSSCKQNFDHNVNRTRRSILGSNNMTQSDCFLSAPWELSECSSLSPEFNMKSKDEDLQLHTSEDRTNERTHIVTYWAPVGAKKHEAVTFSQSPLANSAVARAGTSTLVTW